MSGNVFVICKAAGSVVDVQYVPEFLVAEILAHVEAHHPELDVTVISSWADCS